eukprot:CFRG4840T1
MVAAAKAKTAPTHPKYSDMVVEAIQEQKERNGSSRQAIAKYVTDKYKVNASGATHLKLALKRGIDSGLLVHPKGHSGSYRIGTLPKKKVAGKKKAAAPKKKVAAPKKKVAAKKTSAKKAAPKKSTTTTKPKAKKTAVKAKKVAPKKKATAKK